MLTCQEYIFKLTSGQLEKATHLEKLGALQHRLICRKCRNFTANDTFLTDVLHQYKQNMTTPDQPKPILDLTFSRTVDVPKALVWRAWTEPALLMPWFCPLPWKTIDCEIDLRPGGIFRTTMQSPEGQEFPNLGCYLEIKPEEKLVWTNALLPGYRPSFIPEKCGTDDTGFMFTAMVELADHPDGTRYTATVIHADEAGCKRHHDMGFEAGWGAALDQMVAMIKKGL